MAHVKPTGCFSATFKNLNSTNGGDFSISDSVTETILIGLQRYEEIVTLSSSTSYHVVDTNLTNEEISDLYSVNYVVAVLSSKLEKP